MAHTKNDHPLLAAIFATLAGSFLGASLLALAGVAGTPTSIGQVLGTVAAIGIYGVLIGFPVVLLYGAPAFALMRRLGLANKATAVVSGALPGLLWIAWTHGGWVDPMLWNGVLIALFYVSLRRKHVAA